MASPQLENGYTAIANEIVDALMSVNLSPYETRVLWFIFRKTYGFKKKTDWIALSQFSAAIGLDRRLVHRAIKKLSSKQMIVIQRDDGIRLMYGFQKDYRKWKLSSKEMTVIHADDKLSSKQMIELSSKQIPTKETITKETYKGDVEKHNGKHTQALKLYSSYIDLCNPTSDHRSRSRCIQNLDYYLDSFSFDDLQETITAYAKAKENSERIFIKDPANFFGKKDPVFSDYLPKQEKDDGWQLT